MEKLTYLELKSVYLTFCICFERWQCKDDTEKEKIEKLKVQLDDTWKIIEQKYANRNLFN